MKITNYNQQGKEDNNLPLGYYLESRSLSRGRQLQRSMPVNADNHLADRVS